MAAFKTLQFLPEIFRTDTNRKFLNATVDQLVSEPSLIKVNGYIGRKLAPSYKSSDSYIAEPTKARQDYQLEPTIIIKDPVTGNLTFAATYLDIVNKINFYGGLSENHDRLFNNEFYSYNPQIDLDKFVNFSQYYWLQSGPASVSITASSVPLQADFLITFDTVTNTYRVSGYGDAPNPVITLARGGNYTFTINEPGNKFFIQTSPGLLGVDPNAPNLSTRSVLGVGNNGQDVGTVSFTIPAESAQVQWTSLTIAGVADYATNLSYQSLQGCLVSDLQLLGGLDGPSSNLENVSLIFVNNEFIDDTYWRNVARITDNLIYLDQDELIPLSQRNDIYRINLYEDDLGNQRIYLSNKQVINNEQKVKVLAGATNAGKEYYSRLDIFNEVPAITAPLNLLYYQSNISDSAVGGIQIIDPTNAEINVDLDIVGQKTYVSPGGVVFTNGLKITFDSTASAPYANKTYYVEGVGTAIKLVLIDDLVCPELNNDLATADYLTINRGSIDLNAWSRSNRWFHVEVLKAVAQYNDIDLILDQNARAQRPIIEFNANLQLFNFGRLAKAPIDILDNVISDAYTQVQGVVCASTTSLTITIGGKSVTFTNGDRVVFSIDDNLDVRNKIYKFSIEQFTELPDPVVYRAYIEEAEDALVEEGHTIIVNAGDNGQKQWHYNGTIWIESQQKTTINQPPLFDVINADGVSFGDNSVYPGTTFSGNKLFSYKEGTGTNDTVLGFPLSYKNLVTQGDIIFENNFDLSSFQYLLGSTGLYQTLSVNSGLLQKNINKDISSRINTWIINSYFSKQYQIFSFVYDGKTNLFPIDIFPDTSVDIPNIKIVINNQPIKPGQFMTVSAVDKLAMLIDPSLLKLNDVIFVSIFNSSDTSKQAFYQVPVNFDVNSLNSDIETLTLGQVRNHLIGYKTNSIDFVGEVPGQSNIRDIDFYNRGGSILQHSAPLIYAGLFLNHPTMNYVDSIRLAAKEYSQFKIKFLELAANLDLDRNNTALCVDTIINTINSVKNESFPWHYSDMVPHGDNEKTVLPNYTVFDTGIRSYEITNIFQDNEINNKAVFVYLTRKLDGKTSTILLVKGQDYYFDQSRPAVVIQDTFNLLFNDILTIVEYNNTDGSYVPETPTKLGLYPKFVPEIYLDNTYRDPINVIQGHDGSLTPAFGDFRDNLLLELERRIYNNIKIEYNPLNFNINDYLPGKFRILEYSRQEFNQLLSQSFLRWVGTNRVDFTTNNTFKASDPFTWNYKKFKDVINGESLPGTWRSIFRYFFDTDRPHTHPWEMLGFSEKPSYWDERYGPAPYTGGNFVLWNDLEVGYIHSGNRAGIDLRYSRPRVVDNDGNVLQRGLTDIIPVDENGNLRNPSEFLVTDFDSANANTSYAVGDIGPTELAWRRSSDFAFAMQYALALAKPARYFGLLADIQKYNRSTTTGQFIDRETNQHLQPTSLRVNGYINTNGITERSAGYLNWIRDYVKSLGINDASSLIKENLSQISVQLAYKMAGYSDKRFIEILAEQVSPSSINDSVVIPEENYSIELYKGAPLNKITYSAVIVEKSINGYTVSGFNSTSPYFTIIPSLPNNNSYTIDVNGERGVIYKDFKNQRLTIPYGFEFNSKQQIVDFLVGYQRYLIAQGFIFEDRNNQLNEKKDWILSAKEFLHWSDQGWRIGSLIVLSPVSDQLNVYNETSVVDEITNSSVGSRIIDINYEAIKKNNFTIVRDSNLFTIKSLAQQTIGLAEVNLVQFEHLIVFDNTTVFRDVIYVPETGNRQFRLKLVGAKTNLWNGSLELPGYFYSSDVIEEWKPGQDYLKGSIVSHKQRFYTALENITAADQFQTNFWQQISQNELRSGVVSNFATNASQAIQFYDINDQPLDEKLQLFSNGLIGFRPRQYFTNLGIDITTQSKFYQGLIKQGGTTNAINALKGAQFNNLNTELDFFENWAIRVGEYGSLDINKFVEFVLPESSFDNNPAVFQITDDSIEAQVDITSFTTTDVYKTSSAITANFLRTESLNQPKELKPLPVAGFVNFDDITDTIFDISEYRNFYEKVNNIGLGSTLWTARGFDNKWNVYRATNVPGLAFILRYNINSQAELVISTEHGLAVNDLIALKNFDTRYDGFYRVNSIVDSTRILITIDRNLQNLIDDEAVIGSGIVYKMQSSKLATPVDVVANTPNDGWIQNDKIWVENLDDQGNWGVYTKTDPWEYQSRIQLGESQYAGNDHFGRALALDNLALFLYGGAPDSANGRVSVYARNSNNAWDSYGFLWGNNPTLDSYGKTLATALVGDSSFLAVAAPDSGSGQGVVYIYENQVLMQILADSSGSAGDQFGASMAMSSDAKYLYIGAPGANKVYCYALNYEREQTTQNILGNGIDNSFGLSSAVSNATDIIVTAPLRSAEYFPGIDYTASASTITFTSIPANGERITVQKRTYFYTILDTLPLSAESSTGSKFGSAITCNRDGSTIAVGAAGTIVAGVTNAGAVYVYHKTVSEFTTNGITETFTLPDNFGPVYRVFYNNELIINGTDYFTLGTNIIQLLFSPPAGNNLKVETNQFVLDQTIYPEAVGLLGGSFGSNLTMCNSGCNLYVTSPNYLEANYRFGIVTRYVNLGRVYGEITGSVINPTVNVGESIIINNVIVTFTGTSLGSVISNINAANIPGVTASAVENKLKIVSNVVVAANKLNIVSGNSGTPLQDLGIADYKFAQEIKHPQNLGEIFGSTIKVDQSSGTLVVGSDGADISIPLEIDGTLGTATIFDSGGTRFIDLITDSGAVYVYNLMNNPYEDVDNPSLFAFTQKIYGPNLDTGFNFGAAIDLQGEYLIVGVSNDFDIVPEGGSLYYFYNENSESGWTLTRYKEPRVDIGAVSSAFLYSITSQNILDFFDYLDPAKGKLLGIVDQEIDYREEYDPASYNQSSRSDTINNTNFYWSNRQVGRTWWDLSVVSFIDYEQGILQYRSKNWGSLFPDSKVIIYEWIESDFLPSQYEAAVGDGRPRYVDDTAYTSVTLVDPATGIINQKYYYWVSGKTNVDVVQAKRTLSTTALETYISNPKDQNIPYLALIAPNAIAVYNITDKLSGNSTVIHIDYSEQKNNNLIHNEWQLVQQNAGAESIPTRFINKLKDSLTGFNTNGLIVPDPFLSLQDKLGILELPRQSFFLDRLSALKVYVETLNRILKIYPILLTTTPGKLSLQEPLPLTGFDTQTDNVTDLSYLNTEAFPNGYKILIPADSNYQGKWSIYNFNSTNNTFELFRLQSYKTTLFWTTIDWYSETYQSGKDINYVINIYSDIQALTLSPGNYVKVLDNGQGNWLLYEVLDNLDLELIGAQNGTFAVNTEIFDVTLGAGYDSAVFDTLGYDPQAVRELQFIYESVYEEILIGNLSFELNRLLFTLVNFVFTEQKNPDWIFKTSFIDVFHNLRTLEQFPNYVRDNQVFYNDYINEVKPYRTSIREYVPSYYKQDLVDGQWTDFDLPSSYDPRYKSFRSPDINLSSDAELFTNEVYSDWANNYKFKITDYILGNIGLNYTLPPNVEITGGGGFGAEAITTLFGNGCVSGIIVTNSGQGYTTTPNVFINGDGVGATAYPLMKNEWFASNSQFSYNLVRSVNTKLKFDRFAYSSNLVTWQANTAYANTIITSGNITLDPSNIYVNSGSIVVYNNQAYLAVNANVSTESIFDFTRFSRIDSGNVLLNALDRVIAYYEPGVGMPGKNLPQLMSGLEYPGTSIRGPEYRANLFSFSSNVISFAYEGLTINSANIAAVDFVELGFQQDRTIRIEANVPFDFQNNGTFTIVNVERNTMTLTGQPIETTYKLILDDTITANAGDYVTQANNIANAYVLQSVINSDRLDIIYAVPEFTESANLVIINGVATTASIVEITSWNDPFAGNGGGNVDVTISYLDLQDVLDSNIYSTYLDSNLGIRPQDINIVGGAYVDTYASHAPEELVPGRMYDSLQIKVFSNTTGNTATYGFRVFEPMSGNVVYTRISANATTALTANLNIGDDEIILEDASRLPEPSPITGNPGVIFINGEKIVYYQKYDLAKMSTAIPWTANTNIPIDTLVTFNSNVYLVQGNVYANTSMNINQANIQLITPNSIRQLRRGVDGTAIQSMIISQNWNDLAYQAEIIGNVPTKTLAIGTTQDARMSDIYFRDDGIKLYAIGQSNDQVYEYTLATAWDITTATNVAAYSVGVQDAQPTNFEFKDDGTKFFMVGINTNFVHEYGLSIPWQVNTASYTGSYQTNVSGIGITALEFKTDGSSFYVVGQTESKITQYTLGNSWQVNTASFVSITANISSVSGQVKALEFTPDGDVFHLVDQNSKKVKEYILSNAWAIGSNISFVNNSTELVSSTASLDGMYWKSDGRSLFLLSQDLVSSLNEYQLVPPFESNTASDSSEAQLIPNAQIYTSVVRSGNVKTTSNVSYKVILSSTITANIGDFITQFANTGNARVLESVTNANIIAVDFVTGVFQTAANIGTRINLVSNTGSVTSINANVISQSVLGSVFANGNVVLSSVSVLRSNIWEQFNTTLQNSTTTGAQFIRAEPSYIP